jgi:tRNA dimethylallyltransferase
MISKKSSAENKPVKAIIVCGPTGSGKSALGMELALRYGGSIIGADSRQIYKRLDIGTAKPSRQDRKKVPHYLIDIAEVSEEFTVKDYARLASEALEHIAAHKRIPIVVGGAGLYLEALTRGIFEGPGRDIQIRSRLEDKIEREGTAGLYRRLSEIDPETAGAISPADKNRIIRALEIYEKSGQKPSRLKKEGLYAAPGAVYYWVGLEPPRKELYRRIDERVDRMVAEGLMAEIEGLVADGLSQAIKIKKIVGYYEILDALEGKMTSDKALDLVKQHSRNYAKRQMTWFRNRTSPDWFDPTEDRFGDKVFARLDEYLKRT